MKKAFFYRLMSIMLVAVAASSDIFSQGITNKLSPDQPAYVENNSAPAGKVNTIEKSALPVNEINVRAVRDFSKEFKNVTDIQWFKANDGFVAYCKLGSTKIKVFYDQHGNYKCTVRNYGETELPKEVRHLVKSSYYDFDIFYVTEISSAFEKAYIIKLEGKSSWNDVKVMNNEIISVSEYTKG
ncbi:MAG TPA: hypothetical protein VGD17_17285 [Chitinophagaceae bacterium]